MKKVGIGIVGHGTVGNGVVRHITSNKSLISDRSDIQLNITRVAVRNSARHTDLDPSLLTNDWRTLIDDPNTNIIAELMGGADTARQIAEASLRAKKPFVTANKALLATHGASLFALAQETGTPIYFEASVAGGIPIIKTLRESLRANRIRAIHGIINGTCNYILTKMSENGESFNNVLSQAKALGYAEADESLDVDGHDAAQKAAILASIAHGFWVPMDQVHIEGIRSIHQLDIELARKFDYVIKLLAIIHERARNQVEIRVHPTLIPRDHVLASIGGVYNAVAVEGDVVGNTLFYGRGAGSDPTASAVISDIIEAAIYLKNPSSYTQKFVSQNHQVVPIGDIVTRYYARLTVLDQPGVLGKIASIFGNHGVGISSVYQPEEGSDEAVPLVMLFDYAREEIFQQAIQEISQLNITKAKPQIIRIEDFV